MPSRWERKCNIPGYTRLLAAIMTRSAGAVIAKNKLGAILDVFQKLLGSAANEASAFELLESIVISIPK
jgi:hypothetical protein